MFDFLYWRQAAESKIKNYNLDLSRFDHQIKELNEKVEMKNASAISAEGKAKILEQEKIHLEQKYQDQLNRSTEVEERCKAAERDAKKAMAAADEARAQADSALKEKNEFQRVAMERLAQIEKTKRHAETLQRQMEDLENEVERCRAAEREASLKAEMHEERVREKEKEIDTLLQSSNNQRKNTVQVLESLLESERVAHAEANKRADQLSLSLQSIQGKNIELQQQLDALRYSERKSEGRQRTASKRVRTDDYEMGVADSVHDTGMNDKVHRGSKRSKSTSSPMKYNSPEDGGSVFRGGEQTLSPQTSQEDYTKFTVQKLKQELTNHNFGAELLQLKNPNKKEIVALYERYVLKK